MTRGRIPQVPNYNLTDWLYIDVDPLGGSPAWKATPANNFFKRGNVLQGLPYNVMHYGAIGDGVTDDTTAIQAAIDAAPSDGIVLFPKAHLCASELVFNKPLTLRGLGFGSGITYSGAGTAITVGDGITTVDGFSMKNMHLIGNDGAAVVGLVCDDVDFVDITECFIRNWGDAGIFLEESSENPRVTNNNFDCLPGFTPGGDGIGIKTTIVHDMLIANNEIEGWKTGIFGYGAAFGSFNYNIIGNMFDDNTAHSIRLEGVIDINIIGNIIEGPTTSEAVYIDNSITPDPTWPPVGQVSNNGFRGSTATQIYILNGEGWIINGNKFEAISSAGSPIHLDITAAGNMDIARCATISNNAVVPGASPARHAGPIISEWPFTSVQGNVLRDQDAEAIILTGAAALEGCVISGNIITEPGDGGAINAIEAKVTKSVIANNSILGGTQAASIVESAGSDWNLIHGNVHDEAITTVGLNSVEADNLVV